MPKVTRIRPAGPGHQVVTITGQGSGPCHMTSPCPDCPWRVDAVGVFPAQAFRHSAGTAYDMAQHTFACHSAGAENPRICAGFLLRGADHNLSVRLKYIQGQIGHVHDGGLELHNSYRAMAVANGVSPDDPVLADCRD
ncbi:hypothetical protein Deipr_2439 (plasmid) [Deinococcus proteolyticus MRP]|uniref:Uncharacterized protein n=2 Tax=Deinococcus proteolyticus TaxID=55148 RepID=F0RQJ8_DEIPM|nr:DUF6283 family protein [Deinococcus proteolyticus]ADY27557.1 hypothetical protein Deipr_2439 [Deinococcus proteolyticus MRP]